MQYLLLTYDVKVNKCSMEYGSITMILASKTSITNDCYQYFLIQPQ